MWKRTFLQPLLKEVERLRMQAQEWGEARPAQPWFGDAG